VHYLTHDKWQLAQAQHYSVVANWVNPRLNRRSLGMKHPVDDFMFEYYPISAKKLQTWHPGFQYRLEASADAAGDFADNIYSVSSEISIQRDWLERQQNAISEQLDFLIATAGRPARTGCFGLHEWAMVLGQEELRHNDWPLRVEQQEIAKTIEEVGLRCTHFDAFRFFTEQARPLNPLQLARTDQFEVEQPGCLHANMDLYKIAMRWVPILGSLFARQCFRLARDIRTVDMQSAPYDLGDLGVQPIKIETPQGRQIFAQKQKIFSERAQVLRARMISQLESSVAVSK